tara:strand:- start:67 stop:414 length:348 start_codon:yes stop_codon:yes gene_type:complete
MQVNLRDMLEVPFFGATIFYFSMIKKRNLLEDSLLYFAIGVLLFNLYTVVHHMQNIKENTENEILFQNKQNNEQYENFDNSNTVEYFIPSDTFQGAMDNYVFTTREEGTGYYYDS